MIRTVGSNSGSSLDPAASRGAQDSRADSIAKAQSLGALRIKSGSGEGFPVTENAHGDTFDRFSKQIVLGEDILLGKGVDEASAAIGAMRSEASSKTKDDSKP